MEEILFNQFEKGVISQKEAIDSLLPHRGDMSFLNRVSYFEDKEIALGEILIEDGAFWVPGHFPIPEKKGNNKIEIGPIFPGVLMVESAAQLGICFWRFKNGIDETNEKIMVLKQVDSVKYHRDVRPGDVLYIQSEMEKASTRMMRCRFYGEVLKKETKQLEKCFECNIVGLAV